MLLLAVMLASLTMCIQTHLVFGSEYSRVPMLSLHTLVTLELAAKRKRLFSNSLKTYTRLILYLLERLLCLLSLSMGCNVSKKPVPYI